MHTSEEFRLINYHTHTPRCKHARGAEAEYVEQAIRTGFEVLGFADHCPWNYRSDFVAKMRMHVSELDDYVSSVKRVREQYKGRIRIRLGLECEAFPEHYSWLREMVRENEIEYLILGNHYDTTDEFQDFYFGRCERAAQVERYLETTIAGMETGMFAYLAHPDLFLNQYPEFDATAKQACRELCRAAKRLDMPLEYNLLGHRRNPSCRERGWIGYTSREFWEIAAETGNRAIIGVDAHAPEMLDCAPLYRECREALAGMGIQVIDALDALENK